MGNWKTIMSGVNSGNVDLSLTGEMRSLNGSLDTFAGLVLRRVDDAIHAFINWGQVEFPPRNTAPVCFKLDNEAPQKSKWELDQTLACTYVPGDAVAFICELARANIFEARIYAGGRDQCVAYFNVSGLSHYLYNLGIACD